VSVPSWFSKRLTEFFGERSAEFSEDLRGHLLDLWRDGFEEGAQTPHVCGNFDPSSGGPVGPEGCPACQFLNEKG